MQYYRTSIQSDRTDYFSNFKFNVWLFCTLCPRSLDPFYIVTYYITWVNISLTFSIQIGPSLLGHTVWKYQPCSQIESPTLKLVHLCIYIYSFRLIWYKYTQLTELWRKCSIIYFDKIPFCLMYS